MSATGVLITVVLFTLGCIAVMLWSAWYGARLRMRRRDRKRLQRQTAWARDGSWPLTVHEHYPTQWEWEQDYERMRASGYVLDAEDPAMGRVIWIRHSVADQLEAASAQETVVLEDGTVVSGDSVTLY
jgi:hypothetical protein